MMLAEILTMHLLTVTGIGGEIVEINPAEVVSLRNPGAMNESHFHRLARCIITTGDGKFVAVKETCKQVHELLEDK